MRFRIGVNLGDVMVDGSDIYGEGVNIAARLQELADPGGILISGSVYEQVRNKLSVGFESLGHQQVKNVASPVMSYRVNLDGEGAEPRTTEGRSRHAPTSWETGGEPLYRRNATGRMQSASRAFAALPRPLPAAIVICAFLVLINAFTGLDRIWFHWPVASILLIAALRVVMRRKPGQEGRDVS